MKESLTSGTRPVDSQHVPLHNDIAQCAQELWLQYGKPADRDLAIWLEAEHKLFSVTQAPREMEPLPISSLGKRPKKSAHR